MSDSSYGRSDLLPRFGRGTKLKLLLGSLSIGLIGVQLSELVIGSRYEFTESCWVNISSPPAIDSSAAFDCYEKNASANLSLVCGDSKVSFGLARWNTVGGAVGLVTMAFVTLVALLVVRCSTSTQAEVLSLTADNSATARSSRGALVATIVVIPVLLFLFSWLFVGLYILAGAPSYCRIFYHPLWALTIADVVISTVGFGGLFLLRERRLTLLEKPRLTLA